MSNLERLERIASSLPETERVDIAEWGGSPSFRVRGKNFLFSDLDGVSLTLKLSRDEAHAVVATDPTAEPTGYGLGRHGWISFTFAADADQERWQEVEEWVWTSYSLVAPRSLATQLFDNHPDNEG